MVASIAAEPVSTNADVTGFRSPAPAYAPQPSTSLLDDDSLPAVPMPVPTPVPGPAVVSPNQAFAAALIVERLPARQPDITDLHRRQGSGWQPPDSPLRLTDRQA